MAHEQSKRAADRAGRIRAEQRLKQLNLQLAQLAAVSQVSAYAATVEDSQAADVQEQIPIYPFAPIGVLRSCFNDRYVTISTRLPVGCHQLCTCPSASQELWQLLCSQTAHALVASTVLSSSPALREVVSMARSALHTLCTQRYHGLRLSITQQLNITHVQ